MADHEVRGDRAVYDIEIEEPRGTRRRRPAADWGVSEEIFDRMPSPRRRFRPSSEAPPARRDSHPRRFEPARDDAHESLETRESVEADESVEPRESRRRNLEAVRAAAAREATARVDALMLEPTVVPDEPAREFVVTRDLAEPRVAGGGGFRTDESPHSDARGRGGVPGRRTVVINGQASLGRRRPAPTVPERIGPRPDRLAAYAVALGLLLIIIALLSQ
jgi:hypothetical protein